MCWWYQIVTRGWIRRIRLRAMRVSRSENGRGPGCESGDGQRRWIGVLVQTGQREVDLPRRAVPPPVQLAAEDEPGAGAGAHRQEDEVVHAARDPAPALADRREIDVVLERHWEPEARFELGPEAASLEARDVRGEAEPATRRGIDDTRHAHDDAVDELRRQSGRGHERLVERRRRPEHVLRVRPR